MTGVAQRSRVFVLVHGAGHGGWCWRRVAELLRAAGHRVYTPTLTGLGSRAHLLSPDVGLDTVISDVVGVLEYEELTDAVLVGHSFGAVVACGAADRATEHLASVVLLDGLLARPGATPMDSLDPDLAAARLAGARDIGGTRTLPAQEIAGYGITDPDDLAWVRRRLTPHPLRTYTDRLDVSAPLGAGLPCVYVACTDPAYPSVANSAAMARQQPGWRYRELATGHDAMITAPGALAELLIEEAAVPAHS
jgi:pimeloyl-ACP methyl ester carboxylesterase